MRHNQASNFKGGSSRKNKKKKASKDDGISVEVNLAKVRAMHKTTVDNAGADKTPFPKLPGLVIRG